MNADKTKVISDEAEDVRELILSAFLRENPRPARLSRNPKFENPKFPQPLHSFQLESYLSPADHQGSSPDGHFPFRNLPNN